MNYPSLATLLAQLERAMVVQAPHYREALRPGASIEQIRAAESALGLTLPQVVVDWFTWHDGANPLPDGTGVGIGPAHLTPHTLAESVDRSLFMRDQAVQRVEVIDLEPGQDPVFIAEQLYPPTMLPLLDTSGNSHVDLDASAGEDGALWECNIWNVEQWLSREATSLRATVAEWVRRLEDGTWTYDPTTRLWSAPPVEPEQRRRFSPVLFERELPLATDIWPYR